MDVALPSFVLGHQYIDMVRRAHADLKAALGALGAPMPQNRGGSDLLSRKCDCAVIQFLHQRREEPQEPPFDTVRAAFFEGERLYENAGFAARNHIQIAVRNPRCILGCFRPLDEQGMPKVFR